MWWINHADQSLYQGDCQPDDRAATDAEVSAWLASRITIDVVNTECARRISLVVSDNQKLNMLGSMIASHIQGITSDDANFLASMGWIASMKGACAGLVGNVNYQADSNWPALPTGLAAFGARF